MGVKQLLRRQRLLCKAILIKEDFTIKKQGLSILEIVIIVAILAIVTILVIFAINPRKIMEKSRDDQRLSDLTAIGTAVNLYLADNRDFGSLSSGVMYDSTQGSSSTRIKNDGTGWIPIDFTKVTSGAPIVSLGVDPKNYKPSGFYYRFGVNVLSKTYEADCAFENSENLSKESSDGGNNSKRLEVGTDLTILP